ncbi:unnamed protein product [Lasius platythorax]|uniref:Uncharacterized protein n=1 Tax=Lasius platythorax TaxID=488582 RepID=A0AAV2MZM7_9HYME
MDHAVAGPSKRKKRAPGKPRGGVVERNAVREKLDFKTELDCITCDDLRDMGATNVGAIGRDCLEVVDAIRVGSRNFQGTWSNRMWTKITKVKEVIRALVEKAEASGDSLHLEAKIKELTSKSDIAKREAERRKEECAALKKENEDLRKEITEMRLEMRKI